MAGAAGPLAVGLSAALNSSGVSVCWDISPSVAEVLGEDLGASSPSDQV